MSKLHDEFVADIGRSESVDDNVHSLLESIADRIDACNGNRVKLSDLATVLREDHLAVSSAVQTVVTPPVVEEPVIQAADEPRDEPPVKRTDRFQESVA